MGITRIWKYWTNYFIRLNKFLKIIFLIFFCFFEVGEEDEVSIKQAAEAVVKAMDFKGEVKVRTDLTNKN